MIAGWAYLWVMAILSEIRCQPKYINNPFWFGSSLTVFIPFKNNYSCFHRKVESCYMIAEESPCISGNPFLWHLLLGSDFCKSYEEIRVVILSYLSKQGRKRHLQKCFHGYLMKSLWNHAKDKSVDNAFKLGARQRCGWF